MINLRVAICISGHMRENFIECSASLFEVIKFNEDCNFDIFLHTWNKIDWHCKENYLYQYEDLYRTKFIVVEEEPCFDMTKFANLQYFFPKNQTKGEHVLGQFYGINKVFDMKKKHEYENGFTYDIAVRYRPDSFFCCKPIRLSNFIEEKDSTLFVPYKNTHLAPLFKGRHRCINDVFAFSSSNNMDYYADIYKRVEDISMSTQVFSAESILFYHLEGSIKFKTLEPDFRICPYHWISNECPDYKIR